MHELRAFPRVDPLKILKGIAPLTLATSQPLLEEISNMKQPALLMIIGLLIAGLLLGCAAAPTTPPADDTTPPTDDTTPPTDDTPPVTTTSFTELFGARSTLNAKVAYDIDITPAQADVTINNYTYYFKSGKFRTDISATTAQGTFASQMYAEGFQQGASIVSCVSQTSAWTCYKMVYDVEKLKQQGQTPSPLETDLSNNPDYTNVADGTETRGGMTGNCWKLTKNGDNAAYYSRYCLTNEGLPIYVKAVTADGSFTMEATSAQLNVVTDADFVYPATPQELNLGGMGSGSGTGGGVDASMCDSLTGPNKQACLDAFAGN